MRCRVRLKALPQKGNGAHNDIRNREQLLLLMLAVPGPRIQFFQKLRDRSRASSDQVEPREMFLDRGMPVAKTDLVRRKVTEARNEKVNRIVRFLVRS